MNLQPSGYEPDELPGCSTPRYETGAGSRGRTGTRLTSHGILSPGRLPIPPFRHAAFRKGLEYYSTASATCQGFREKKLPSREKKRKNGWHGTGDTTKKRNGGIMGKVVIGGMSCGVGATVASSVSFYAGQAGFMHIFL